MRTQSLLKNIQVLRALAAMMVVLYHARIMTPIGQYVSFDFGNSGVDIFFIISGFIISYITLEQGDTEPGRFLLKRAVRLIPLYWLLTIAIFAAAQYKPELTDSGGAPGAMLLLKSLLFIPYFNASGEMHPLLFLGWTLDFEVFFYLIFAAALLIRDHFRRYVAVSIALCALVAAGLIWKPEGAVASTYTHILLIEFLFGVWLNLGFRHFPLPAARGASIAFLLMLGLAGVALLVTGDYAWPQAERIWKWGVPAMMIVTAGLGLERLDATFGWKWMLLLGEASYAIYLIHPFVIKVASIAYGALGIDNMAVHAIALIGLYIAVMLAGVILHIGVERPLMRWLRHRLIPRAPDAVVTGEISARLV